MNHTQEPWSIRKDGKPELNNHNNMLLDGINPETGDGYLIAYGQLTNEDSRRIVACVNACAGIDTDNLEKFPGWAKQGFDQGIDIHKQRGELLAALKEIWTTYLNAESTSGGTLAYIAKDAIAKVEGA